MGNELLWEVITPEKYYYYLGCLPPAAYGYGDGRTGFLVGEASDSVNGRPTFQACKTEGGKYYASSAPMLVSEFQKEFKNSTYHYGA